MTEREARMYEIVNAPLWCLIVDLLPWDWVCRIAADHLAAKADRRFARFMKWEAIRSLSTPDTEGGKGC